ncbi:hypothetical protein B566_EDAN005456 [Ephemera danica]|nr:hypothetical protein B566_EDAN005456 [Ephemera danica]
MHTGNNIMEKPLKSEDDEGPRLEIQHVNGGVSAKLIQNEAENKDPEVTARGIIKYSYKAVFAQGLMAGAVFLLTAGCGMPIGFSAIMLPQIQSANSSLPTSEETGSWIASIHSAATPVGSILSGPLMEHWGRRTVLRFCVLPFIAGWTCMATAQGHVAIFAARILAGFAVGLSAAPSQVLLGEVAEPHIRGMIVGAPFVSYSLGILLVYALGSVLAWRTVAAIATILPLSALLALFFLPESPHWLARVGRESEALEALTWLRGGNVGQARAELAAATKKKERSWLLSWRDSPLLYRSVVKPLLVVNTFNVLQILSGTYTIIFYAVNVIEQAENSEQDPGNPEERTKEFGAAVLTALVRTLVTALACGLLLLVGRRPLAMLSGLGSATAVILLGIWLYIAPTPSPAPWLPEAAVIAYVACNTFGFFVLPGLMLGEMLPARARGPAGGVTFTVLNLTLFVTTKVYPQASHLLRPYGVFWFFGAATLLATVFVYLFVPETKGKSLAEIEDYFSGDSVLWMKRPRKNKMMTRDQDV